MNNFRSVMMAALTWPCNVWMYVLKMARNIKFVSDNSELYQVFWYTAHSDYASTDHTKIAGMMTELFCIWSGSTWCLHACLVFNPGACSDPCQETQAVCLWTSHLLSWSVSNSCMHNSGRLLRTPCEKNVSKRSQPLERESADSMRLWLILIDVWRTEWCSFHDVINYGRVWKKEGRKLRLEVCNIGCLPEPTVLAGIKIRMPDSKGCLPKTLQISRDQHLLRCRTRLPAKHSQYWQGSRLGCWTTRITCQAPSVLAGIKIRMPYSKDMPAKTLHIGGDQRLLGMIVCEGYPVSRIACHNLLFWCQRCRVFPTTLELGGHLSKWVI